MDAAELQRPPPGELFLDHVSHFVRDLDAAAGLLEQLGFVVAPVSVQEVAGSRVGANRCVMLEQGYIEILTPTLQPELDSNTVRFKVVRPASGEMPEGRIQ